jgi:hypothetical protein
MKKKFRAGPPPGEPGRADPGQSSAPEGRLVAGAEASDLRRERDELAAQSEALRRQLAERDAQLGALLAGETPASGAERELASLRRQVAAQAEALQRRESRRQVYDSQLREREAWIDERDAEIGQLRAELQEMLLQGMPGGRFASARMQAQPLAQFEVQEPSATELAEARIAQLASELSQLHVRTAAGAGGAAATEAARLDQGLQAELAALRRANDRLRSDLAERDARLAGTPGPRDTGTFAATSDFAIAGSSGSYVAGDGELRMFVRTEGESGIVHVLGRRTTIGRTPDNDLVIESESVSRHHAVTLQTPGGTVIEDLNSTNGVFVNGQRVSRRVLSAGDVVTIGTASFRFLVKRADEAANS